ncbi:hypothetical protein FJT64_021242 [Amphibalanus amphitrite]|uniref:Uncharacterized protein n=1 Tax=Amphibalanus amphitrite TaxID=1232801 RepID=A0A6A4WMY7_AMPAM|nr:hypothetical protein FJT64_021242 [Amphibalanus amphitrite]
MPCEPPSQGLEVAWRLRRLLRDLPQADGCLYSAAGDPRRPQRRDSATPPEEPDSRLHQPEDTAFNTVSDPAAETVFSPIQQERPAFSRNQPVSPARSPFPPEQSARSSARPVAPALSPAPPEEPARSPSPPGEEWPLAEAALARRFARRWCRQVSDRRQRRQSAPEDRDAEWTVLESDGLGPGPELRRLRRPAALRQAAAALRQRGRSAVTRLVTVGRLRLARGATSAAAAPRPVHVVRCGELLSPEPDLPLFESVSCDNLADLQTADPESPLPAGADSPLPTAAADSAPPPPYPGDEPPPYSLAVSRPTPAERLLWHGLDADQVTVAVSPADRALWRRPPSPPAEGRPL